MLKEKTFRSPKYLRWVRELPCCHCGTYYEVQAHHAIGVSLGGTMGGKQSDITVLPLCASHHQLLHAGNLSELDQLYHLAKTMIKASNAGVINA